ncbi:MAG TPA: MBOAT family O-acyltransferase, partial [Acidobacteriaceae bacterium]|nr:MBOAT family O-acyltransferase [Acidobacteriaceae bacterium]
MLFNSFQFLLFFVVVWLLFLATRGTPRKVVLLIASYYFYMCWSTRYIFVIWGITLIDYIAGLEIEKAQQQRLRRLYLGLSLFCNIGLLVFFKYFNFLLGSFAGATHLFGLRYDPPLLSIILPVGLSFHTFQAMSYTIEVYRRKVPAEKRLLEYALYVAFFPQMVAGPIERPNQLLPQFHREPKISPGKIRSGLAQALWGLFKKIVIADNVSEFVKLIYSAPSHYDGAALLLATTLFSLQIYCDFSGYTDMALGLARMMGYELVVNFRQPYFSRSIGEFWRRWHISLSTWFRDYVYIPLGGNRVSAPRHWFNLMATFVISGLWHGANWTFVAWGFLHGVYLIVAQTASPYAARLGKAVGAERFPRLLSASKIFVTFALVTLAWIFFRASTVGDAWFILAHLLPLGRLDPFVLKVGGFTRATAPFLLLFVVAMFLVEWWLAHPSKAP